MHAKRPLIICDVDEVVLQFVAPFEGFLGRQGLRLLKRSFALSGNIFDQASGEAVSGERTGALVHAFFESETGAQPRVHGAAEALADLSGHADILFLTNFPEAFREQRRKNLVDHGMPYPLHTNSGPKGKAAAQLAVAYSGEIFFLDDIGANLVSVRDHIPNATLIHFISDRLFFNLAPPVDEIDFKTKNWRDATNFIKTLLKF